MAGFNNTPPASEFHTHQSWGRTRSPKQRFLHITHEAAGGGTLEVWGYMHASGQWGQIGADITTAASLIHTVVEIAGVDKIKIKANTQTITKLWLACSTF